jgi:heptosyltransferase-2
MCQAYTKDIVEGNPYLNEVITFDKGQRHPTLAMSLKVTAKLRKKRFDWAIILHPTNRAHWMTFLAGIPERIGWNQKWGILLTKALPHKKQEGAKHEIEYSLDILRSLGIPIETKRTYVPTNKQAEEKVAEILSDVGIASKDRFIIIHPSASCPSKRWPQKNFSQLIKLIYQQNPSLKVIIVTSEKEKHLADQLVDENDCIDFRGLLNIPEFTALISSSKLFISNDSGPMHIAAALGIPVIAIFGRNDPGLSPQRWKPMGQNCFYFHKNAGCKKCLAHRCKKNFACLNAVTPQEIADKIRLIILSDKILSNP